jgi:hypothetical protein
MSRQKFGKTPLGGLFTRPILIHVCKDGTISYRTKDQPVFNGVALPVFSVDTEQQAQDIQVRYGRRQYVEHDQLPGQPWYKWTDFSGDVTDLDDIEAELQRWWDGECKAGRAS